MAKAREVYDVNVASLCEQSLKCFRYGKKVTISAGECTLNLEEIADDLCENESCFVKQDEKFPCSAVGTRKIYGDRVSVLFSKLDKRIVKDTLENITTPIAFMFSLFYCLCASKFYG